MNLALQKSVPQAVGPTDPLFKQHTRNLRNAHLSLVILMFRNETLDNIFNAVCTTQEVCCFMNQEARTWQKNWTEQLKGEKRELRGKKQGEKLGQKMRRPAERVLWHHLRNTNRQAPILNTDFIRGFISHLFRPDSMVLTSTGGERTQLQIGLSHLWDDLGKLSLNRWASWVIPTHLKTEATRGVHC